MAAEQVVLDYLKSGSATAEGLGKARAECGRMIESLRKKVQR
jgi:hypothetical protein